MASNIRRLVWNTRERLTSTDLNNCSALHHRALIESVAALAHGDTVQYGVVRGLVVSIVDTTLTANVSPGLAIRSGSAPTTYDSATEWIELSTTENVDLSSYVDVTNPRWVVIEIADADAVELNSSRDIWQPATGTFVSNAVDKVSGSDPTITVTAGTAAATPYLPAGTAGRIPLAYIYIPAAAVSLDTGDIVSCRPIVKTSNFAYFTGNTRDVKGGGVFVTALGTEIGLIECLGFIGDSTIPFSIGRFNATDVLSCRLNIPAEGWDGAAAPVIDTPAYLYAIQPPYPTGYGALADREFIAGDAATGRFPALVSDAGEFRNCVVIASTEEPNVVDRGGAPVSGNFSISSAPWSNVAVLVNRQNSVYLGAAVWDAGSDFITQTFFNGGRVHTNGIGGALVIADLHNGTTFSYVANDTIDLWEDRFPITARELDVVFFANTGTATGFLVQFETDGGMRYFERRTLTTDYNIREYAKLLVSSDGEITLDINGAVTAAETDLDDMSIQVLGYTDNIIAKR